MDHARSRLALAELLIFEQKYDEAKNHLGTLLRDHFSLRLVTLNACMDEPVATQNPYLGVAQSLVRRGLPAVVALQFAPPPMVASTFADDVIGSAQDNSQFLEGQLLDTFSVEAAGDSLDFATHLFPEYVALRTRGAGPGQRDRRIKPPTQ